MQAAEIAYIGLGSNLNNPVSQLKHALNSLATLPHSQLLKASSFYCSPPMGPQNQPDFVNAVAKIKTCLPALDLLNALQTIENQQGRVRTEKWGPRTLDLDILLYGNQQSQDVTLTLPHVGLYFRAFVLYPLYECEPDLVLPDGRRLQTVTQHCAKNGLIRMSNESQHIE